MNNQKYAIMVNNVSKKYKMYKNSKEKLLDLIHPKGSGTDFYALKDLSFSVEKGKSVGLIGVNGAGKSTLSNILAGVSLPTSGEIKINGQPAIIAIGSGLNNFLTGIENIEIKALMMGFDKDRIEEIKQKVIDFAEIGEFINQPIRTYSSGMRSRLGFAISIHIDPDIIVIDEALSVGDQTFTSKCLEKMKEFKENGKTIIFVSHSIAQVKEFCDEAIWLEYGMIKDHGSVKDIIPKYQQYLDMINKMSSEEKKKFKETILKNQEHYLLKEFKLIDSKYKKLELTGKVIKYAKLVNQKGDYKVIPYNFDYKMFILGSLSSLLKKQFAYGCVILFLEAVAIFISPGLWGILTRFILTFSLALFSGKRYTDELINNKGYIPFEIYKEEVESSKDLKLPIIKVKKINKSIRKENAAFSILSLLSVIGIASVVFITLDQAKDLINIDKNDVEVIKPQFINEKLLIIIESDGVAKKFAFLDISNESIISEYYPAELLVNYKEDVMPLYEAYIKEGCIPTEVMKGVLKKDGYSQVIIDEKKLLENNISLQKDVYKSLLTEVFNSRDDKLLNSFKSTNENSMEEVKESLSLAKEKYEGELGNKYRTQKGSYKYKSIEELTTGYIIRYYALDKDMKYYYLADEDLENYKEVIRIRELEKQRLEEEKTEVVRRPVENSISGESNMGSNSNLGGSNNTGGNNSTGSNSNSGDSSSSDGNNNIGDTNNSGGNSNPGSEESSGDESVTE